MVHVGLTYHAYDLGVSAEADGYTCLAGLSSRRGRATERSIRRHRSRVCDFPLTFPLQVYFSTLDCWQKLRGPQKRLHVLPKLQVAGHLARYPIRAVMSSRQYVSNPRIASFSAHHSECCPKSTDQYASAHALAYASAHARS